MPDATLTKVIEFTAKREGRSPSKLSGGTRLFHDLGMDGDDAYEFLIDFKTVFGVDLSEFDFSQHFGPEAAFNPFAYIYWLLFQREKMQKKPVTLKDLAKAADTKRWLPPEKT